MKNYLILIFILLFSQSALGKVGNNEFVKRLERKLNLYVNGDNIDFNYIRDEVRFVNYVRDKRQADIYVLITRTRTGITSWEYTLNFTGQDCFNGINDTLKFHSKSFESENKQRNGLVRSLKHGLYRYIKHTYIIDYIDFEYQNEKDQSKLENSDDKWDNWVFRSRLNGEIKGESQKKYYSLNILQRVERITKDWKLRFSTQFRYEEESYNYEDKEIKSVSRKKNIKSDIVKTIGNNLSIGLFSFANSDTYENTDLKIGVYPAIEYNLFPYSEATYKQLRFVYRVGVNKFNYIEETIFEKKKEILFNQRFEMRLEINQQWGELFVEINYFNQLDDFSRNRFIVRSWFSVNLFEGFGIDFGGGYSKINDQFYIPKREVSIEEILLQRKEVTTQYNFWMSIGISYTFGSMYNNIFNPSFGN